jgi:hypothetical protein
VDEAIDEAAAITSSPKTSSYSSKPLLDVSTVEARSYRRVISWRKSIVPVGLMGSDRFRRPRGALDA